MAMEEEGLALLLAAKRSGVNFERTVMLGHQHLMAHRLPQIRRVLAEFQMPETAKLSAALDVPFSDALFHALGATEVASIDAGVHDSATLQLDLNQPIPSELHGKFTAVVDSGTLEHVFDTGHSFRNLLDLAAVGGHVIIATTCVNYAGHGFHQFSPELVFRLFEQNGFENARVFLVEASQGLPWHEVIDPAKIGRRVEFTSDQHVLMFAVARRARAVPFSVPMQSDYVALWGGRTSAPAPVRRTTMDFVRFRIGRTLMKLSFGLHRLGRRCGGAPLSSWYDRAAFTPVRATDVRL
jgi:hypothetical protein